MQPQTVTSVSGGRTSSYLSLHYPTDYNIFSLVRIEDERCKPKDKKLIQYVEDKIQQPFIATAESDLTLYVLIKLEQDLGKDIIWVTGDTFEQTLYVNPQNRHSLPNRRMRYCTTEMKMKPIFWWCYLNLFQSEDDYIQMNIGYRIDEPRRMANDDFKFDFMTNTFGQRHKNWKTIEWRDSKFPLRDNGVDNLMIKSYFAQRPYYVFPKESNCVGCFNKTEKILQEQFFLEPEKMRWFKEQEIRKGRTWNISDSLTNIETKDFTYGQIDAFENVTCNCTD